MDDPETAAPDPIPGTEHVGDGDHGLGPGATAFMGLGLSIGVAMAVLVGGGLLVDNWLHCSPWGLLVGLAVGLAMAVVLAVGTVKKYL